MWRMLVLSLVVAALVGPTAKADARERCLGQVERALDDVAHVRRARRALDRCASRHPGDAAWVFLAARLLPTTLEPLVRPSDTVVADARRVRALAGGVTREDDHGVLRRVVLAGAWAARIAGEAGELAIGLQDPEGVAFLRRASALHWRRGEVDLAERELRRARRSMPQDVDVARELAALLVARGRPDEAVPLLAIARQGQPDSDVLQREHALALLAAGRGDEALALLADLSARDTTGEDRLRHAAAALELGRAVEAEASARASLALLDADHRAAAHALRGLALLALGRREEARASLQLGADDVRARSALAGLE